MTNWRTNAGEVILNHFEGNRDKMCYKWMETCDYRVQKYLANFGFKQRNMYFHLSIQGNEQNQHIYFSGIFSFPLSKILVKLLPC